MNETANMTRTVAASVYKKGSSRFGGSVWKSCTILIVLGSMLSAARLYCTQSLGNVFRKRLVDRVQRLVGPKFRMLETCHTLCHAR